MQINLEISKRVCILTQVLLKQKIMENKPTFAPVVGRWIVIEQPYEGVERYFATRREDLTEDELKDFYSIFGIAYEGVSVDSDTMWVADRLAKYCKHDATFCEVLEGEYFSPDPDGFIGAGDSVGDEDTQEREHLFAVKLRESHYAFYFMAELLRYGRTEIFKVDDFHRF